MMKRKNIILLVSALTLSLAAATAYANYGDDNELKGKVRINDTKTPIYKAKVKLYTKGGGKLIDTDKTSRSGKYKFEDLEEKEYKVKASADGFRNPKNPDKSHVTKQVDVDGTTKKNLYLQK